MYTYYVYNTATSTISEGAPQAVLGALDLFLALSFGEKKLKKNCLFILRF
jgi:hypothetical protein